MKFKSILTLSLLSTALLVGCSDGKENVSNPIDSTKTPGVTESVNESNPVTTEIQDENEYKDEGEFESVLDSNEVAKSGSYIPPIESFKPAYNYPVNNSKSRDSREVKDILTYDGGWWLSDYEDNHSVFVTQDGHNEYKTTTKHGLLIYDSNSGGSLEEKWTNHYFKGIYFNPKDSVYELKFVIDNKTSSFLSVGLNSLVLDGVEIPDGAISFDWKKTVGTDSADIFTVFVEYQNGWPLEVNTMSFNYEFYGYYDEVVTEIDSRPMDIFMELSR